MYQEFNTLEDNLINGELNFNPASSKKHVGEI